MQDIERKIIKSLKLSRGAGTKEEAQNAFVHAQRIAVQYGIDLESLGELPPAANRKIIEKEVRTNSLSSWWRESLAELIAKNFKCNFYRSARGTRNGKAFYALVLVGFEGEIEIASAVYDHAERSIMFFAREYIRKQGRRIRADNKKKYRDEYIKGYIDGLSWKFAQQVKTNGWELAIVVDQILIDTVNTKPGMGSFTIARPEFISQSLAAYNAGHRQGIEYVHPKSLLK